MTGLEVLLAVAGFAVTALVVTGMILITPRGEVDLHQEATDPQGSHLSRTDRPDATPQSRSAERHRDARVLPRRD